MATISLSLADLFQDAFGESLDSFVPEFAKFRYPLLYASANSAPYYAYDGGREMYMPVKLGGVLLPFPVVSISCKKTIVETPMVNRRGTVKELINIEDYVFRIHGLIIGKTNDYPESDIIKLRQLFEQNIALQIECAKTDIFLISQDRSAKKDKQVLDLQNAPDLTLGSGTQSQAKPVSNQAQNLLDQVIIREMEFPPISGIQNVQPYTMVLVSDTPFNLILD